MDLSIRQVTPTSPQEVCLLGSVSIIVCGVKTSASTRTAERKRRVEQMQNIRLSEAVDDVIIIMARTAMPFRLMIQAAIKALIAVTYTVCATKIVVVWSCRINNALCFAKMHSLVHKRFIRQR